jgi:hypothetical protein
MFKLIALLLGTIVIDHGVCVELNSLKSKNIMELNSLKSKNTKSMHEALVKKKDGKQRIIVIGDSLTTGYLGYNNGKDRGFTDTPWPKVVM